MMTFGESHGAAVGCVVDGCPAGLSLDADAIRRELARRRPGAGGASTSRSEPDEPELLSGVFEGRTLGTPIAIVIRNTAQRSSDYDALRDVYRPGHADIAWELKYGVRDHRGGGRASARETAARVAAGAVAKALLAEAGVSVLAWTAEAAGVSAVEMEDFDLAEAELNSLRIPSRRAAALIADIVSSLREAGDSAGGIVECRVRGLRAGAGEPVFDKLDAVLAQAVMSIGAVKGIEFGAGFAASRMTGSECNDTLLSIDGGRADYASANAGGVLGGISNGADLVFRAAFKPVPSIARKQRTLDRNGRAADIEIAGRHDACVCPRAVPVVEAMTALALADLLLRDRASRLCAGAPL